MKKTTIKMQGTGTGAHKKLEVLTSAEIKKLIGGINPVSAYLIAHKNYLYGYKHGYCAISIITGEVFGYSLEDRECFQAVDAQHIELCKIDKDDPDPLNPEAGENFDTFVKVLTEELGSPEEGVLIEDLLEWYASNFPKAYEKIKEEFRAELLETISCDFNHNRIEPEIDFLYSETID